MLNPFPILFLSMFAHLLLRLVLGGLLVFYGIQHIRGRRAVGKALASSFVPFPHVAVVLIALLELLFGAMFIIGWYTQVAALGTMALSGIVLFVQQKVQLPHTPGRSFYILLMAASLSLFITGAGALAFDLPI